MVSSLLLELSVFQFSVSRIKASFPELAAHAMFRNKSNWFLFLL